MKKVLQKVSATGVLDLPNNTYLVPDAPVIVTLARIEGRPAQSHELLSTHLVVRESS